MISYNFSGVLLIATVIGVVSNVNGASLDVPDKGRGPLVTVQQRPVTLQDFKEYLQPIIYNKLLRPSADSPVVQQAKAVVSEVCTTIKLLLMFNKAYTFECFLKVSDRITS